MRWSEIVRTWGTTPQEQQRSFPCDKILPDHNEAYYRSVSVLAEPATVFRWLCQLRVAPYSYDWIDNLGRRSPRELDPDLENLELGQHFMDEKQCRVTTADFSGKCQEKAPGGAACLPSSAALMQR